MNGDLYGINNYSSSGGLYGSLAGGSVPQTQTYTTAATNSPNGVSSSWNLGSVVSGVSSLATAGANIYANIANASKKPGETNITLLDPNTGRPAVTGPVMTPAGNNNTLLIIAGVVLVAIVGFFAFFKSGKGK